MSQEIKNNEVLHTSTQGLPAGYKSLMLIAKKFEKLGIKSPGEDTWRKQIILDVSNIIKLVIQEQCRTIALINVISEKLGLDETEIINKVNELIVSKYDVIEQETKDICDMSKQINAVFNK